MRKWIKWRFLVCTEELDVYSFGAVIRFGLLPKFGVGLPLNEGLCWKSVSFGSFLLRLGIFSPSCESELFVGCVIEARTWFNTDKANINKTSKHNKNLRCAQRNPLYNLASHARHKINKQKTKESFLKKATHSQSRTLDETPCGPMRDR